MPEETVSPLTSAQCLAIAERKVLEAMSSRRHGKELKLTAQAWLVLAEKVRQGEGQKNRPRRLKWRRLRRTSLRQPPAPTAYSKSPARSGVSTSLFLQVTLKTSLMGLAGFAT